MGTCHDVESVTTSLTITNVITFEHDAKSTEEVFEKDRQARERFYDKVHSFQAARPFEAPRPISELKAKYKNIQDEYFDENI